MLASTTCADVCDDIQLTAAHALDIYREGSDVTVHWTSREGAKKTLAGKLLKVWAVSQSVINTQTLVVDAPARVCANPLCKGPLPTHTSNKHGQTFICIAGDLPGLCSKCYKRCRSASNGETNYKAMKEAMDTASVAATYVHQEILVVLTEDKLELHVQRTPSVADWTMVATPKRLNALPGMQDR